MSPAARSALVPGLAIFLLPSLALAIPLDPFDPTPRAVRVEFEVSVDPGALGAVYSAPLPARYSVTGNTGTLVMPGEVYEAVTPPLDYFGYPLIPSTAEDFVVAIDLTTLEAAAQPSTYQVDIDVEGIPRQTGTITRILGTEAGAGFVFVPSAPGIPVFCTEDLAACTLVPGSAYDPGSGTLNAVGSDRLVAPDITFTSFSRAGELRVTEASEPADGLLRACALATALLLGAARISLPGATRNAVLVAPATGPRP